ncbi:hypothetical protein APE_1698.1 [Aeropyrum pernix K1]|uniref:Uncharacterized protein n=1 Tax=Aeropyrum pernix (strain ATCC 700893 / DSM 11879 / JCM 9820 / NBRC 100138 / K1) TaxID=272557 RepID=Q9YB99_AERPE|nr:hypothetical protein [Aeropyrum pernix]BAA80699.2 hypothetical protein APE_1698.1 [Aeropyrum pernix K1]
MASRLEPGSMVRIGDALCRVSLPVVLGFEGSCLIIAGVVRVGQKPLEGIAREPVYRVLQIGFKAFLEGSEAIEELESQYERAAAYATIYGGLILYSKCGEAPISRFYSSRMPVDLAAGVGDVRRVDDRDILEIWSSLLSGRLEFASRLGGPLALPEGYSAKLGLGGLKLATLGFECMPPYVEV